MRLIADLLTERRQAQNLAVVRAIQRLRPARADLYPIARLAGMSLHRTRRVLTRLMEDGAVEFGLCDGPVRRLVYKVTAEQVGR